MHRHTVSIVAALLAFMFGVLFAAPSAFVLGLLADMPFVSGLLAGIATFSTFAMLLVVTIRVICANTPVAIGGATHTQKPGVGTCRAPQKLH